MPKEKTTRRDFLKGVGAGFSVLTLGLYGDYIGKANSKNITNEIPRISQENFPRVHTSTLGELDGDEIEEIIMAYNADDGSSLVKFYPLGEEGPFDVRYDFDPDKDIMDIINIYQLVQDKRIKTQLHLRLI